MRLLVEPVELLSELLGVLYLPRHRHHYNPRVIMVQAARVRTPGVILSDQESESIEVIGVANLTAHRISDSAEGVDQLRGLAEHARRYVAQKGQEAEEKILNKANTLPSMRLTPPAGIMDVADP